MRNIIKDFTADDLVIARKIRQLQAQMEQLKYQQAPTVHYTPAATITNSLTAFDKGSPVSGNSHLTKATLSNSGGATLFAIPEVEFFISFASADPPSIANKYQFPVMSGPGSYNPQWFDFACWLSYVQSDNHNLVAKIYQRNRINGAGGGVDPTGSLLVVRFRYITPGTS